MNRKLLLCTFIIFLLQLSLGLVCFPYRDTRVSYKSFYIVSTLLFDFILWCEHHNVFHIRYKRCEIRKIANLLFNYYPSDHISKFRFLFVCFPGVNIPFLLSFSYAKIIKLSFKLQNIKKIANKLVFLFQVHPT